METYRPQQKEVIQGIVRSINAGYKYIIAECPTGSGKSPIAVAIGALAGTERAYYITTTKHLQDQIETDFPTVVTLKGRNAYPCTAYQNFQTRLYTILGKDRYTQQAGQELSCDEGYCKTNTGKASCSMCLPSQEDKDSGRVQLPQDMNYSFCPYYEKLYGGINAQTCSMNFNNFILHLNAGHRFSKRKILIIDECFHAHTFIETEIGRIPIGKIVNQNLQVRVKSWNFEEEKFEYKRVTRWLKRDENQTFRVLAGNRIMYPTMDHKIYTPNGLKKLSDLRIGDQVMVNQNQITDDQEQLVLGSLLGDASLDIVESKRISKKHVNKGNRARISFRHGPKQYEYLLWKHSLLKGHVGNKPKLEKSKGFGKTTARFQTNCGFYDTIMPTILGGRKTPKDSWLNKIGLLGLAVWYMDDGGKSNETCRFHTQGFDYSEVVTLRNWLTTKWDLAASVHEEKKEDGRIYFYISLNRQSSRRLMWIISKFVPTHMRYKLLEFKKCNQDGVLDKSIENDSWPQYNDQIENQDVKETTFQPIISIDQYKYDYTYDLEVEDNHNYVAGNTVVSNCHNTEAKLLDYLECTVSSRHIETKIPELTNPMQYVTWLQQIGALQYLKDKIETARESQNLRMMTTYEGLFKKYINMMIEVKEDPTGWVVEYEEDKKTDTTKATLKPIFAHRAAKNFLFKFADHIVFLSATILNAKTFARNLGIQEGEYAAMRIPSQFPIVNRPITTDFAGRFTGGKAKMNQWIGDMSNKVVDIALRYKEHRGIIHTHSFGIQRALIEKLPPVVSNRLIQQFDFQTKTEMIEAHAKRPGSIIIAPAMHEGVDLKDDLSRFQILCKVPFANFYENKQLEARMELDSEYYDYITILKIIQSVGRSVRSMTDWADTFIIDESFDRIYRNNQNSFPLWFKEAVTKEIPNVRKKEKI